MIDFPLILAVASMATCTTAFDPANPSTWYKAYPDYPEYCSTLEQMKQRSIPPLPQANNISIANNIQLVHVTSVLRHGARTPTGTPLCWEGYSDGPESIWDCPLTTINGAPSTEQVTREQDEDVQNTTAAEFLFTKEYTALEDQPGLGNTLKGSCKFGQLLMQGYEQHLANGKHFRQAYIESADTRLTIADFDPQDFEKSLYFRSDDEQRTMLSGQTVIRGMLEPEMQAFYAKNNQYPHITMHTADVKEDIMDFNFDICPRLGQYMEEFMDSDDFQEYMSSENVQQLDKFQQDVLKTNQFLTNSTDCLMTTICTDRTLPAALNDYNTGSENATSTANAASNQSASSSLYGTNLFQRFYYFQTNAFNMFCQYNDSTVAKLAMGPLWNELLLNIRAVVRGDAEVCCPNHPTPKVAVFAAHDSTIIPLLITLGIENPEWPPYASYMNLELYVDHSDESSIESNRYLVRLVHNGKVLTPLVQGCDESSELCPVDVLLDLVSPFAISDRECDRTTTNVPTVSLDATSSSLRKSSATSSSNAHSAFGTFVAIMGNLLQILV